MPATSSRFEILTAKDDTRWCEALATVRHDFYHEASYHAFCEKRGDGTAYLAVYREGNHVFVWPDLVRLIEGLASYCDVTSVYGYPGPLASNPSPEFIGKGLAALRRAWRAQNVVSVFSRLHPLLENQILLQPDGPGEPTGTTVAIDLTRSPDEIRRGYPKRLKHGLNRARRLGMVVEHDTRLERLPRFAEIYRETMARNQAAPSYFFDLDYFEGLFAAFPGRAHLFTAVQDGITVAGAVFIETAGIVQYHLSATDNRFLSLSPSKLVLDEALQWAADHGHICLHLGGGRGGEHDTLFAFKAAFSRDRHPFFVWKSVLQPDIYRELCRRHGLSDRSDRLPSGYFPAYRADIAAS